MIRESHRRGIAQVRCTRTAIACELFRIEHDRWPESLEHLVPTFLAEVPVDPFDGEALRYLLVGDGVVIYSIGHDEVDDGGELSRQWIDQRGERWDIGIRLWDVVQRRLPAPPIEAIEPGLWNEHDPSLIPED
jgi:hypothetical protein